MRGLKNPKTKERSDETIIIDLQNVPKGTMMSSSRQLEDAVDAADSDNSLYGSANNTSIYETSSGGSGSGTTYDMDATPKEMSSYFVVFFFLLALSIILSNALHKMQWLPEAAILIMVGAVGSCFIYLLSPDVLDNASDSELDEQNAATGLLYFGPNFFFSVLLPPIIFNSGYHVNGRLWVRYFDAILLYSLMGTAASICAIAGILNAVVAAGFTGDFQPTAWELLAFASLISSTDPVSTVRIVYM